MCEESSTVSPFSAVASIKRLRKSRRASGSKLASGSSSSTRSGHLPSASVSATCACCPVESLSARRLRGMPRALSRASAAGWSHIEFSLRPIVSRSAIEKPA